MIETLSKSPQVISPVVDLSHLTLNSTLADLPAYSFEIGPNTPGQIVAFEFERRPDLPGVIVVKDGQVWGAFSRRKFLERVGRPYGVEVYLKRPIHVMLRKINAKRVQLPSSYLIHQATQIALSRPPETVYEPIVVEYPDWRLGLLNIYTLLLAQSQLLTLGYEIEQNRRQFAEALQTTGRALSSTLKLHEVTELILQELAQVVAYDRGSVMLRQGDNLEIVAQRGFPEDTPIADIRVSITPENELFQRMIATHAPLLIGDVTTESSWQQVESLPWHYSWLGVPLIARDRVIGILSLTRAAPNAFSADDADVVSAFTGQAAVALENARLYGQIVRFTNELEQMVDERTRELIKAYQTLEKMDKTKSDFIKISAHELRTPVTVIKGYTQVLATNPALKDNANAATMLEGIISGTNRLHQIVNNLLDVAKIASDNLTVVPESVALAPLIERIYLNLKPDLKARQLNLILTGLDVLPPLQADPELLPKIFSSLIVNAIKYTPDGGTITVKGRVIERLDGPSQVEITVCDTGIGIDPTQLELIFEKFYQTNNLAHHSSGQTKFKGAGPGLGLAIAKGIVEAHGGQIWAESQEYNEQTCPGSCFYVRLPIQ